MCTRPERQPHFGQNGDPSRSKSHLTIGDCTGGGALTRREQSPEPEQITSENWRPWAGKGPRKNKAFFVSAACLFYKNCPKLIKTTFFWNLHNSERQARCSQK